MKYPVGKLLTREYSDIERRILQARLICRADSWKEEVEFICKDGRYGRRKVNEQELWDIAYLGRCVIRAPYVEWLFKQEKMTNDPKYARLLRDIFMRELPASGQDFSTLMNKYKWLYDTETGRVRDEDYQKEAKGDLSGGVGHATGEITKRGARKETAALVEGKTVARGGGGLSKLPINPALIA